MISVRLTKRRSGISDPLERLDVGLRVDRSLVNRISQVDGRIGIGIPSTSRNSLRGGDRKTEQQDAKATEAQHRCSSVSYQLVEASLL
jgi:hypothetical protein